MRQLLILLSLVATATFAADEKAKPVVKQSADEKIALKAIDATVHGKETRFGSELGHDFIGWWSSKDDHVSWELDIDKPGEFSVEIIYSCPPDCAGSAYDVTVGANAKLSAKVANSGGWQSYKTETIGKLKLAKGKQKLVVQPTSKPGYAVMDLAEIRLSPVK